MKALLLAIVLICKVTLAGTESYVRGVSLTEIGTHLYDATEGAGEKKEAQIVVDMLFDLGVRHIVLSPRAKMNDPRGNAVKYVTPASQWEDEELRYGRLISYIKGKGGTVGMRPMVFVVDAQGNTPLKEPLPGGGTKDWWHGNIQPSEPNKWFDSFGRFLKRYAKIGKDNNIDEFTLGAELYSMTVGIEDQWEKHPYGFPGRWVEILEYMRKNLPEKCRIMYDINYTDATIKGSTQEAMGGEFARWYYRLYTLSKQLKTPADKEAHANLVKFWNGLDAIGIDNYRSLANDDETIPEDQNELVELLQATAEGYSSHIHEFLHDIQEVTGKPQKVILKEIGFRAEDRSFIHPFDFTKPEVPLNVAHQAAAYQAIFGAFWEPQFSWFNGITLWDASVDLKMHGPLVKGFSPLKKEATEKVIRDHYQ